MPSLHGSWGFELRSSCMCIDIKCFTTELSPQSLVSPSNAMAKKSLLALGRCARTWGYQAEKYGPQATIVSLLFRQALKDFPGCACHSPCHSIHLVTFE